MAKYYVQSGNLRLVLDAGTARDAAMRAVQRCHDRQAEIFREPPGDRIRDIEVLDWQLGRQIRVSEVGFDGDGDLFETASVAVQRRQAARANR